MQLDGDSSVIEALKEKKRLMDAGEAHEHIKPLLIVGGGFMKGAYGVGAGYVFEDLGYASVCDDIVGISSGAPSAAYYLSGEVRKGGRLVSEECCDDAFFDRTHWWRPADCGYIVDAMRPEGEKAITFEHVRAARTRLHIGVTRYDTAESVLLTPDTPEDFFNTIHASILMPSISTDVVCIDGVRYVDGGFAYPHVLKHIFDTIAATHILLITNQDKDVGDIPLYEKILNKTLFRFRMSPALRTAAPRRRKERLKVLESYTETYATPLMTVWGNSSIGSFERDPEKVKEVISMSEAWWRDLLAK